MKTFQAAFPIVLFLSAAAECASLKEPVPSVALPIDRLPGVDAMYRMSMILAACALTACVGTQSTLDDAAAPLAVASQNGTAVPVVALSPTDATVVATEEATIIDADEADTGLVCESVKRPGSRIAEEVCYNRDVRAANEEAKEEQIRTWMDAVQRDQETRQMWEEMERQRRSMGRMGQ